MSSAEPDAGSDAAAPADIYCELGPGPGYKAGAQVASCLEDGFSTPSGSCEACQVDAPCTAWFGAGHCVHLVKRDGGP